MKKVFIFSNSLFLKESHIQKLNISNEDICFLCNNALLLEYDKIKTHPNKYLILGTNKLKGTLILTGLDRFKKNINLYKKVIVHNCWDQLKSVVKNNPVIPEMIEPSLLRKKLNIEYPSEKDSTIGFKAITYALNYLNDYKTVLVGFTGHRITNAYMHDFDFEQGFINKLYCQGKIDWIYRIFYEELQYDLNEIRKLIN